MARCFGGNEFEQAKKMSGWNRASTHGNVANCLFQLLVASYHSSMVSYIVYVSGICH